MSTALMIPHPQNDSICILLDVAKLRENTELRLRIGDNRVWTSSARGIALGERLSTFIHGASDDDLLDLTQFGFTGSSPAMDIRLLLEILNNPGLRTSLRALSGTM